MTINLGSLEITYYSICILLGIICGYILVLRRRKLYSVKSDDIDNLLIISIPSAIVGSRIYHVVAEWDYYQNHLDEIVTLRLYGMGIFGAVFGAIIAISLYCRLKKINILKLLDLGSIGLILGQVIGRFGNWFNKELYGFPTNLPWRVFIPIEDRISGYENFEYFHPTFIYESIWNLVGVLLLLFTEKRLRQNTKPFGIIFCLYLIWYGLGRFLIGFVRLEPDDFWILNDGQIVSIVIAFVALALLWKISSEERKKGQQLLEIQDIC